MNTSVMEKYGLNINDVELENYVVKKFNLIGLKCIHSGKQILKNELNDQSFVLEGDHIEIDFLIPYKKVCFIGEITARNDFNHKFKKKFLPCLEYISNAYEEKKIDKKEFWKKFGVSDQEFRFFREVEIIKGVCIATQVNKYDGKKHANDNVVTFYQEDWQLFIDYAESIGRYSKNFMLNKLGVCFENSEKPIQVNHFIKTDYKKIMTNASDVAEVYTFTTSPYNLLPIAQVFRRDDIPCMAENPIFDYQRPLNFEKLQKIRSFLRNDKDFMFPTNILIVLNESNFVEDNLLIPNKYGAISVIDGQHRLFSYADSQLEDALCGDGEPKIMVTAIKFKNSGKNSLLKQSARTFVEINTNQTTVKRNHIDSISYQILGNQDSRSLAGEVINRINVKESSSLYGIFDYRTRVEGVIPPNTVVTSLKRLLDYDNLIKLRNSKDKRLLGYKNYFKFDLEQQNNSKEENIRQFLDCITIGLEYYFNHVRKYFPTDWPERNRSKDSSLSYAKMIAGFVQLLDYFIGLGYTREKVNQKLLKLRNNLCRLRKLPQETEELIFIIDSKNFPNANNSEIDNYKFLKANCSRMTSLSRVLYGKSK
jgi:DGQHR domain-containing protein